MDTTPAVNENIRLLVENLRRNGKQVPARLSEIPDFPYSQFDQLQAAILSGAVQMKRFPFHYDARLFDLLASPFQCFLSTFYTAVAFFLVPLISIVMAFVHSWWWLLGISAIAVGLSRKKRLYNRVMLSSAFQSEAVFSFLYFVRQVCIISANYRTYYWGREQSDQRDDT